jgi:hypothetical protein
MKPILKSKAYQVNLSKIEEGYMYSTISCYAENNNEAKSKLLKEEPFLILNSTQEEVTYITIPVIRCKELDLVEHDGVLMKRHEVISYDTEKERQSELDGILLDENIQFCYIKKRGSYYCDNHCGYTSYMTKAGVYNKKEAVSTARNVSEIYLIPIDVSSHNNTIESEIRLLEQRLIK